jgi:replicative DNA helicase
VRNPKEIEFAFLGCIFDNPSSRIPNALRVKANIDWFSDQSCRLIWASIDSIRKKTPIEKIKPLVIIEEAIRLSNRKKSPFFGQKISPTFIDEAKRFRDSADKDETTTIESYAPILQEAAIGRRLNEAMEGIRAEGKFTSNTARMLELSKQIQQIQKDESPESGIDIASLVDNMQASYDKSYEEFAVKHNYNYIPGIPYPWDCMSHMTGGLTPGLHIVAARPSVGKTSFVLQCCTFWNELGYKVAFDCLDMSVTELIKRPIANLSWVSPKRCEKGWTNPKEQQRVKEAAKKISDQGKAGLITWTVEPNVDKLKSWAEVRHRAGKLDILVVDFIQRFQVKGTTSEYEISTYASGVLKQLANECLIPVIVLSQLSRDNVKDPNGKRPPELSDLRGSGALEQDATTVVLLHKVADVIAAWRSDPPLYYLEISGDPRLDNERQHAVAAVSWNLAKNQNGPTGELPFVVFQQCFRWYVGDEDSEKAEMYHRIMADWRFLEEPFVTAEKNNSVVYPDFWPQKCAEACGKLGLDIPSHIRDQLKTWDIDRYNALLKEHSGRISDAIETAAIPITKDEAPPSVVKMVEKAASGIVPSVKNGVSSDELDKRMAASPIASNIELTEDARAFSDNFDEVDF